LSYPKDARIVGGQGRRKKISTTSGEKTHSKKVDCYLKKRSEGTGRASVAVKKSEEGTGGEEEGKQKRGD